MQPLARDGLTADQVRSLLTADALTIHKAGMELLDTQNLVTADITDDVESWTVERHNRATVHGTCTARIQRELAWGRDRLRPYLILGDETGAVARFNLGVFVATITEQTRGETPSTFPVSGVDLLHLLQDVPGDTYVVEPDGVLTYHQAIQDVVTASGVGATLWLSGDRQDTLIQQPLVWVLSSTSPATWLRILNDLLDRIGYRGVWADPDGNLRSELYVSPATRAPEWRFDTSDARTNLVGEERVVVRDTWAAPNWWRFVQERDADESAPTLGDGIYEPAVNATDPALTDARRIRRRVEFLSVADQTALVARGDQIVDSDRSATRVFRLQVDPLPVAGHFDVVELVDGELVEKCQVTSWTVHSDGSPGAWELEAI